MSMEHEAPEVRALAHRLEELDLPEVRTLAARVIDRYHAGAAGGRRLARASRQLRLLPAAAVAVGLVVAVLVGSAESPAIANAPVISPVAARMLGIVGVSPAQDHVTPVGVADRSAGQTISVVTGYADSTQTVVIVNTSPSGATPVGSTLTEANGSVVRSEGFLGGEAGDTVLEFGPLNHPSPSSNQLTLHVSRVVDFGTGKGPDGKVRQVSGDWTLHFSLPYENDGLPVPAPGQLGPLAVTFSGVAVSSTSIHVRFTTTGATMSELVEMPSVPPRCTPAGPPPSNPAPGPVQVTCAGGTPGTTPFWYQLLDPNGKRAGDFMNSYPGDAKGSLDSEQTVKVVEWDTLYHRAGPGTYRLVMTWRGYRLERDIQVG